MVVYVLLYDTGYYSVDFHGVYSTKENAIKRVSQFGETYESKSCNFVIDEHEIDEELR